MVINPFADARGDGLIPDTPFLSRPIITKITDIFSDHSIYPLDEFRTSTLSNLILEETVTADSLAEDEINYAI
jgi:hypothetical protein